MEKDPTEPKFPVADVEELEDEKLDEVAGGVGEQRTITSVTDTSTTSVGEQKIAIPGSTLIKT